MSQNPFLIRRVPAHERTAAHTHRGSKPSKQGNTMSRNDQLFERAQRHIPGGVNSPVRAFGAVGGTPRFFQRGLGAYVWDADDKRYIDYVGSWGPLILGHANPEVLEAVQRAAELGLSFGAPTD